MSISSVGADRVDPSAKMASGAEPSITAHSAGRSIPEETEPREFSTVTSVRDGTNNEKRTRSVNSATSTIQPPKRKPRASASVFSRDEGKLFKDSLSGSRPAASAEIPEDESFMGKLCKIVGPESVAEQSTVSAISIPRSAAHETITSVSMHEPTTVSSLSVPKSNPSSEGSLTLSRTLRKQAATSKGLSFDSMSLGSKSKGSGTSRATARLRSTLEKVQAVVKSRSRGVANRLDAILDRAINEDGWIMGPKALNNVMRSLVEVMENNRVQEGKLYQNAVCLLTLLCINRSKSSPSPKNVIQQIVKSMQLHSQSENLQHVGCGALHILATSRSENQKVIVTWNGVHVVIQAMRLHKHNENIQKEGCRMLRSLSAESMDNAAAASVAGGYNIIVGALLLHPESGVIQRESFRTLLYVFLNHAESLPDDVILISIDVIKASLRSFAENAGIQKDGCRLLRELVAAKPGNAAGIAAETDSSLLLQIMRLHLGNACIQKHCCALLKVVVQHLRQRPPPECFVVLVRVMRQHEHVADIQKEGCSILFRFSFSDCDTLAEIVSTSDGVGAIVNAMSRHEENVSIQLDGCAALGRLPCNEHSFNGVCVVASIARAMRLHEHNEDIQTQGCLALGRNVLGKVKLRSSAANSSAEVIVQAICRFSSNTIIEMNGCRALRWLVEDWGSHLEIADERIVAVVVQAILSPEERDLVFQTDCCVLLSRLLDHRTEDTTSPCRRATATCVRWILRNITIHEDVNSILRNIKDVNDIQAVAFRALRYLIEAVPETRSQINDSFRSPMLGIKIILRFMKFNTENTDIQRDGCIILNELEVDDLRSQQSNAVEVIFEALHRHLVDVNIQRNGIRLLRWFSYTYMLFQREGIDVLLSSMRAHENDAMIQGEGCRVLHNLARMNSASRLDIFELGGIEVTERAMSLYEEEEGLREEACGLFGVLGYMSGRQ